MKSERRKVQVPPSSNNPYTRGDLHSVNFLGNFADGKINTFHG